MFISIPRDLKNAHIIDSCFIGTGAVALLPQFQWIILIKSI